MRPTDSGGKLEDLKRKMKDRAILIVVVIVIVFFVLGSIYAINHFGIFEDSYFEVLELEDEKISPGEKTALKVGIRNVDDYDWDNYVLRVRTKSSKVEISREGKNLSEDNEFRVIQIPFPRGVPSGESAYDIRSFDIEAGELSEGEKYVGILMEIIVLANGEVREREELTLEISE